jgi:hypothetical protein
MKAIATCAGAAFFAAGLAFAPAPAAAFSMGAGASLGADLKSGQPLIEQVQYRRSRGYRPAAAPVRHVRRGNRGAAIAAGAALGVIGAAAIASTARARPAPVYVNDPYYYPAYQPAPYCEWRRQDLYDRWGNYVGARKVKVCH